MALDASPPISIESVECVVALVVVAACKAGRELPVELDCWDGVGWRIDAGDERPLVPVSDSPSSSSFPRR